MSSSFRPITIRSRLEIRFEHRLQNQLQRPLHHTVATTRNRQNADFLAPVLRDFLLSRRQRHVGTLTQFVLNLRKEWCYSSLFDSLERDPRHYPVLRRFAWPSHRRL